MGDLSVTLRVKRVSPHVWQVRLWRLTSVHVWLVADGDGLTLVDTGFGFMVGDVLRAAELVGRGRLRRVLLTHGHPDHAGGARSLSRELGVPVLAHRLELPFLTGERRYPKVPGCLQAGLGAAPVPARPLPELGGGGLRPIGGLTPWFAPGHTPGHVVYHHEHDGVLLAGDLFTAHRGRLRQLRHLYSVDKDEAARSERLLVRLKPRHVEASHGGSVAGPTPRIPAPARRRARRPE